MTSAAAAAADFELPRDRLGWSAILALLLELLALTGRLTGTLDAALTEPVLGATFAAEATRSAAKARTHASSTGATISETRATCSSSRSCRLSAAVVMGGRRDIDRSADLNKLLIRHVCVRGALHYFCIRCMSFGECFCDSGQEQKPELRDDETAAISSSAEACARPLTWRSPCSSEADNAQITLPRPLIMSHDGTPHHSMNMPSWHGSSVDASVNDLHACSHSLTLTR